MKRKHKGFTLVELLVVVVIIGIIAIIAIPTVNTIKDKNEQKKYQKYQESVNIAGELFTDSFHEDMFGITGDGCYDVDYEELNKKNLIKDYKTSGITCKTPETFVHITRKNGKYKYETSIKCVDQTGKIVYKDIKERCDPPIVEDLGQPVITASAKHLNSWGLNWSTKKEITIEVKAGLGLNSNAIISYGFSNAKGTKPATMTRHRYINKYGEKKVSYSFIDDSNSDGSKKNGQYYLYVEGKDTLDVGGHNAKSIWIGPLNYDNESPVKPTLNNVKENIWAGKEYVDAKKYVIGVQSKDNPSGVAYYQYRYPESNESTEKVWRSYDKLSGDKITTTPFIKERNHVVEIRACDYANNCSEPGRSSIKIDKTIPVVGDVTNSSKDKWVNHDVILTAAASDPKIATNQDGSGIQKIVYTYDKQEFTDWNVNKKSYVEGTWGAERDNNVYIIAYDVAGNKSKVKPNGKIRIDKTKPTISNLVNNSNNIWSAGPVTITANVSDNKNGSGVNHVEYNYGGNKIGDLTYANGKTNGSWYDKINTGVNLVAYDNAGNSTSVSAGTVKIDKTAPSLTNSLKSKSCEFMKVAFKATDTESGVSYYEYKIDNGEWKKWDTSKVQWKDKDKTIYFRASDKVGNVSGPTPGIKIEYADCDPTENGGGGGNSYCLQLQCDGSRVYQNCYDENGFVFKYYNGKKCNDNNPPGDCKKCEFNRKVGSTCYAICQYLNGRNVCTNSEKVIPCPKPPSPPPKPRPDPPYPISCSGCVGPPGKKFNSCNYSDGSQRDTPC